MREKNLLEEKKKKNCEHDENFGEEENRGKIGRD